MVEPISISSRGEVGIQTNSLNVAQVVPMPISLNGELSWWCPSPLLKEIGMDTTTLGTYKEDVGVGTTTLATRIWKRYGWAPRPLRR